MIFFNVVKLTLGLQPCLLRLSYCFYTSRCGPFPKMLAEIGLSGAEQRMAGYGEESIGNKERSSGVWGIRVQIVMDI